MARKRLSMRKTREILRLKHETGLSVRQIAGSCGIAASTVSDYLIRAKESGVTWPLTKDHGEKALNELLFESLSHTRHKERPYPEMANIHKELRRKGVTLQLLWQEYRETHPDGYGYSQFCEHYHQWKKTITVCLRQEYKAGDKMFVDWAGQTVPIIDRNNGKISKAHIFVAVLGASNYTYAVATHTEQLHDWIDAHIKAFEYFGGVCRIIIPDNTKTAISKVCRYEPVITSSYNEMAQHYHSAIIPARVARPRDKAKVEAGVQIAERWILALLRHWNFFNLTEVNSAITHLLKKLNDRPFKKIPGTRTELFETIEKPALRPLPLKRYELAHWQKAKANIDYHVQADKHFYSVPHQLVSQEVEVRLSDQTVEIFYKGKRVASHKRSYRSGCYTTDPAHRPRSHQKYLQWTPSRLIQWAGSIGHECAQVVEKIIANRPHPEQGYRACLGIIRLGKHYGKEPLKAACERAIALDTCNYRSIESILKTKLYEQPFIESPPSSPIALFEHENVRGKYYYT